MKNEVVIFFGIGRGGKIALDYYSNRFSNDVDTLHFYIDQETVSNERSGEKFNVSKHRRLLSEESICVNFSEVQKFLSELDFDEMYDIYSNNYQSIRNLLNQLVLINAVVENVKNKYCKYIFIRDDTIVDLQNSFGKYYWDRNPEFDNSSPLAW